MKAKLTPLILLDFLKIPYTEASGGAEAILAECPLCGKEDHFYLNFETGLYYCHKCNSQGNDWKNKLLSYVAQKAVGHVPSREYWESRGFTPAQQAEYLLGYWPALDRYTVPYPDGKGGIENITFRHTNPNYTGRDKYLRVPHIYNAHYMIPGTDPIAFIVEGEVNAICVKLAFPEATVIGLSGGKVAQESIIPLLPKDAVIHALIDSDKGPSKKLKSLIPGIHIHLLNSDANEMFVANGLTWLRGTIETAMLSDDNEEDDGPAIRSLEAPAYLALPDEIQDWLVEDLWADRALGFVAGIPKSMKSMLTLHLAHHISAGKNFLTKKVNHPGVVLLVQEEDNDHTIRKRLSVFNGETSTNFRLWTPGVTGTHIRLDTEQGLELLDSEIQRVSPVLVILDPLANMHMLEDENNAGPMNKMLEGLRHIRDLRKTSILIVHHLRKEGQGEGPASYGQRMRGSSVLHAKSESALYLERVGVSDLVRVRTESKLGAGRNLDVQFKDGHFVLVGEYGAGVGMEQEEGE